MRQKKSLLKKLFRRITKGWATGEEKKLFDQWHQQLNLTEAGEDRLAETSHLDRERVLENLRRHIAGQQRWYYWQRYGRLSLTAAAIAFLIMGAFIYRHSLLNGLSSGTQAWHETTAAVDTIKQIRLADGTTVVLNSGSRLRWQEGFNRNDRTVYLQGEGYFQVAQRADLPFKVVAGGVETLVLGTRFNVESGTGEQQVNVSLLSGRVKVQVPGQKVPVRELKPGELAMYHKESGALTVKLARLEDPAAWIYGDLVFNELSLSAAIDRLSKRYHLNLQFNRQQLTGKTVTAHFPKDTPWEDALRAILFSHGLDYHPGVKPNHGSIR